MSRQVIRVGIETFQFTRPIRAAIDRPRLTGSYLYYFNSRDPYGPRCTRPARRRRLYSISIHATHTGRDVYVAVYRRLKAISIHATHTGRDLSG